MAIKVELDIQDQNKGGLPELKRKPSGKAAMLTFSSILALLASACSVPEAQNNTTRPAETAPIPGANEPQLAMQAFEINKEYPEALKPYVDVFKNMAGKDKLDLNLVNNFNFILAKDPVKGTTVEYALMPMAVVNGLTDPDGKPANQKPVYYLAYKDEQGDEQGQVKGNYVLGRLLEQDSEGNVSYVSRILSDASFQDWLNNTQSSDSQIELGQIVNATALANGLDIEQAREIEQQLISGKLSSADFMNQHALGVSFIQPGQAARQVTIAKPLGSGTNPVEPSIAPSFWSRLFGFGVQPALAAGLKLEATATAPGIIPTVEPTSSAEPTLSAEQQQQLVMDQFVNEPFYDQYIADNQIPEQAATAFYQEYPGTDGQSFAVVTMKVNSESLSEEQKALNIAQRDYLVVKTEDGRTEFKQLPINLQLETFSKSAVEFTLGKEYQKGLQDYLNAMELEEQNIAITQEQRSINGVDYLFINSTTDKQKLTESQLKREIVYGTTPIFIAVKDKGGNWEFPIEHGYMMKHPIIRLMSEAAGISVGTNIEQWTGQYLNQFNIGYLYYDWSYNNAVHDNEYRINTLASQANINKFVMGHLVMPSLIPSEIMKLDKDERITAIEQHAFEITKRFGNRVEYLTIVNEPHNTLSKDEILAAFRGAKRAGTSVKLVFSETDNHYSRGPFTKLTYDIVELLKQEDLVDAVAAQAHVLQFPYHTDNLPESEDIANTLRSYGLPILITEFDINQTHMGMMGIPKNERDLEQAFIAYNTVNGFIDSGVVEHIIFWGVEDIDHWLSHEMWGSFSGSGGSPDARATIFNNGNPKAFLYAFLKALYDNLPSGGQ